MSDYLYKIPDARYHLYKYIIAINHYQNTLLIIENQVNGEAGESDRIESLLNSRNVAIYSFKTAGKEKQNILMNSTKAMVRKGKEHCYLGDVFQVVLSRQFQDNSQEMNLMSTGLCDQSIHLLICSILIMGIIRFSDHHLKLI